MIKYPITKRNPSEEDIVASSALCFFSHFSLSLCSSFLSSSSSISLSSSSLLPRGECPWLCPRGGWLSAGVLFPSSLSPSFPRVLRLSRSRSGETGELSVCVSSLLVLACVTEKRPTFLWLLLWLWACSLGGEGAGG